MKKGASDPILLVCRGWECNCNRQVQEESKQGTTTMLPATYLPADEREGNTFHGLVKEVRWRRGIDNPLTFVLPVSILFS